MFDPTTWGNVAEWTGALVTGLSVSVAVVYYLLDRRRERRAQAASVVVWLHPHEHGPPLLKMMNLSDKPVFDHGWIIMSKPDDEISKLDPKGEPIGPFDWPSGDDLPHHESGTFINYHDGSEIHLAKGQSAEYQPTFTLPPWIFDYYVDFHDARRKRWVVDAKTRQFIDRKQLRHLEKRISSLYGVT